MPTMPRRVLSVLVATLSLFAVHGPAGAFPEPLAAALKAADARASEDMRLTFLRTKEGPSDVGFAATFDPKRPVGSQWTIVAPPKANWSANQKESIDILLKQKDADLPLIITTEAAERMLGKDMTVVKEAGNLVTYGASVIGPPPGTNPQGPGNINEFVKFLKAEITVDQDPATLTALRIFAPEPFKPYVVAKVSKLDVRMALGEAWAGGPIAIVKVEREVKGSATVLTFDEKVRLTYRDFALAR